MDPTEWPLIVKLIAGWGPLGVWAAYAELRARRAERDHHATRTAHEEATRTSHESVSKATAAAHRAIAEAAEAARREAAEKDEAHRKQIEQLTDRFVRLVENQSRQAHRLADGVGDRIRKARKNDDDEANGDGSST